MEFTNVWSTNGHLNLNIGDQDDIAINDPLVDVLITLSIVKLS